MLSLKHICLLQVKVHAKGDVEDIPTSLKAELELIPPNVVSFFRAITNETHIPSTLLSIRPSQFPNFMLGYLSTIKPTKERQYIMKYVVKFNLFNNDELNLLFTHTPHLIDNSSWNMVASEGIFNEAFAMRWYAKLHFGRLKANESFKYTDRFTAAFPYFNHIQQCKGCYVDTCNDVDAYITTGDEHVCSVCSQVLCMECEGFNCRCGSEDKDRWIYY